MFLFVAISNAAPSVHSLLIFTGSQTHIHFRNPALFFACNFTICIQNALKYEYVSIKLYHCFVFLELHSENSFLLPISLSLFLFQHSQQFYLHISVYFEFILFYLFTKFYVVVFCCCYCFYLAMPGDYVLGCSIKLVFNRKFVCKSFFFLLQIIKAAQLMRCMARA